MDDIRNIDDAKRLGLTVRENEGSVAELLGKFRSDLKGVDAAAPPSCADKAPGELCFVSNCIDGQRLYLFCGTSKGCGSQYAYRDC